MNMTKRTFLAGAGATAATLATGAARAQTPAIKMMMDWAWQGPQAPFLLAEKKGYFRAENVAIQLDRGFGSLRTPTEIAQGTYQMGFADLPTVIQFLFRNPTADVRIVAAVFDQSPLCVVTDASGSIRQPKDLEGKKVAAPETDGGRQMFPALAKATGIDLAKINWLTVQPALREPMLARGEADAITGFVTSARLSLEAVNFPESRQRVFMYRDYGLPFFSGAILASKTLIDRNPEVVRGAVKASLRGFQDSIRNPDEAITALRERESLTDVAIERRRLMLAINDLIVTPNTRANGLSAMDPARLDRNIAIVKETFSLPGDLKASDIYDGRFLPEAQFRQVPGAAG